MDVLTGPSAYCAPQGAALAIYGRLSVPLRASACIRLEAECFHVRFKKARVHLAVQMLIS